jgi:hypothetical protein
VSAGRCATAVLALLVGFGCAACASTGARFPTTDPHDRAQERRPPGVAVDPMLKLPAASRRGRSDTGIAELTQPPSRTGVEATVAAFFRAIVAEAPEGIDAVLTDQAYLESPGGRQPARGALRARFAQLDYAPLRGIPLYRERDLEVYSGDALELLQKPRNLPDDLARDQVFVRLHPLVSNAGKTRLLSDEIGLSLRRDHDRFRITAIRESAPAP